MIEVFCLFLGILGSFGGFWVSLSLFGVLVGCACDVRRWYFGCFRFGWFELCGLLLIVGIWFCCWLLRFGFTVVWDLVLDWFCVFDVL